MPILEISRKIGISGAAIHQRLRKLEKSNLLDVLNNIIKSGHEISVIYLAGNWLDVDDAYDLAEARNFTP